MSDTRGDMQDAVAIITSAVNHWGDSVGYIRESAEILAGKDDTSLRTTALAVGQLAGSLAMSIAEGMDTDPSEVMQALALEWALAQEEE